MPNTVSERNYEIQLFLAFLLLQSIAHESTVGGVVSLFRQSNYMKVFCDGSKVNDAFVFLPFVLVIDFISSFVCLVISSTDLFIGF